MTPSTLSSRLNSLARRGRKAKVVIPVELTGQCVDRPALFKIAREHGSKVIIDGAHSLGAHYEANGQLQPMGSCRHADAVITSFHPVKHITTAEGGCIFTDDETLALELKSLRQHGITKQGTERSADDPLTGPWYYEQQALGFNYRISDVQCALGLSQLKRLGQYLERRRALAARYRKGLAPLAHWLRPLSVSEPDNAAYHLFVVQLVRRPEEPLESWAERRKALYLQLRELNILTQVHYIPVPMQPDFSHDLEADDDWQGALEYYACSLSLPLFPAMSDADVDRVIGALCKQAS